jgi:predicted translin family RNA/ssDNA-binding protein
VKGLILAEKYYNEFGSRILSAAEALCPGLSSRLSIGLAGEGSQCLGYDDTLSWDHDFAPGFCVWMSDEDYAAYGPALQPVYDELPGEFCGFSRQNILAPHRLGIMGVSDFFGSLTGIPETDEDWLFIPEDALAAAVSGLIWQDGCEEFRSVRTQLNTFYPADVLRKKIAARAAVMSQAGQYNLIRMMKRSDRIAAMQAASRFAEAAISMIHLLSRKYTPFYKWAYRSLQELAETSALAQLVSSELAGLTEACILPGEEGIEKTFDITETICRAVSEELRRQRFSETESNFLQDHLDDIMNGISNPQIRAMHPMADPAFR